MRRILDAPCEIDHMDIDTGIWIGIEEDAGDL
jgi:hypothetical protein